MQHTMLVIKLKRAIGADLVLVNKVSVGKEICCWEALSQVLFWWCFEIWDKANGDFSREQTVLRSLLAWSEVVGSFEFKVLSLRRGRLQFQASVTQSSAARTTSECLSVFSIRVKWAPTHDHRPLFILRNQPCFWSIYSSRPTVSPNILMYHELQTTINTYRVALSPLP
jgi:hypothetical protein